MVKLKNKKILVTSLLSTAAIASVATIAPFAISNNHIKMENSKNGINSNSNIKYLFDNKYYDSIEDISNELLVNNKLISNDLYYGDINEAVFDQEFKRLDINKLKKYDPNRISSAYITSTNGYESDFEKAKKTFINQGLVRYFYLDNEGKLHYNFDSAKQSNMNNIKVDEIVYYKIKDVNGNEKRINPLNKNDINLFKKIAIDHLKSGKKSDFDLKIFTNNKTNSRTNENEYKLNEELTSIISWSNDRFLQICNEKIQEILFNIDSTLTYDFKLSLNGMINDYKFQWCNDDNGRPNSIWSKNNIENETNEYIKISDDGKSLYFRNLKIKEIEGLLNRFANRTNFIDKSNNLNSYLIKNQINVWGHYVPPWYYNKEAEEAYWTIKLGDNNYWIHLNYIGNYDSIQPGIDFKILQNGELKNGVGFDISLVGKNNIYEETFENKEANFYLDTAENHLLNNIFINSDQILLNKIMHDFLNNSKNVIKSFIMEKYKSYFEKKSASKNDWSFDDFNIKQNENNFQDFLYKLFNQDINMKIEITKNLFNAFSKSIRNTQVIIYYKEFPVFECDTNSLLNNIDNQERLNIDDNLSIFLREKLSDINIENINNISNLKNLSQDSYIKYEQPIVSINQNNIINIPPNKLKMNGTLNKNNEIGEKSYYDFWYAFNAYNKNLENYLRRNNNSIESIKNELVNLNNILFLRNGTGNINDECSSQPLYYANHLGLKNDFNEQVSYLNRSNFAYNEIVLGKLKEASSSINPSKVVILYNISGEIMNPGVKLDDDLTLVTSSDAIFDLEQNLLDNVMRTLLIQKAVDKFYYSNDDGTKTLIKNKVNQIYTLNWRGYDYHFATFNDAKKYLNSIVELLSTRVEV